LLKNDVFKSLPVTKGNVRNYQRVFQKWLFISNSFIYRRPILLVDRACIGISKFKINYHPSNL